MLLSPAFFPSFATAVVPLPFPGNPAIVMGSWLSQPLQQPVFISPDVANAYLHDTKLTDNPAIPAAQRGAMEWSAAANMQRHLHDSNLEENKAVLDVIRRRVEAFDDRFHTPRDVTRALRLPVLATFTGDG